MTIDEYEIDKQFAGGDDEDDVDPELVDLSILEGYSDDDSDGDSEDFGEADNWEE